MRPSKFIPAKVSVGRSRESARYPRTTKFSAIVFRHALRPPESASRISAPRDIFAPGSFSVRLRLLSATIAKTFAPGFAFSRIHIGSSRHASNAATPSSFSTAHKARSADRPGARRYDHAMNTSANTPAAATGASHSLRAKKIAPTTISGSVQVPRSIAARGRNISPAPDRDRSVPAIPLTRVVRVPRSRGCGVPPAAC